MKNQGIAVTGLVSPARHHFMCPSAPSGAALADSLTGALSGAGIVPDGMSAHPGAKLPAWPGWAATAGQDGVLCDVPGMLWALEDIATALPDVLFVVCYEAPWLALDTLLERASERFLAHPRAALDLWRRYYREALRLRSVLGPRMVLVNAQFTGGWDTQLLAYLGDHGIALPPAPGAHENAAQAGWAFAQARLLDIAAPECWDLYEALEGCAVLLGRAPQFRQTLAAPSDAHADAVLQQWSTAHGERRARAELAAAQGDLHAARAAAGLGVQREATLQGELDAASRHLREVQADVAAEREHIVSLREALQAQARDFATEHDELKQSAQAAATAAAESLNAIRLELACAHDALLAQVQDSDAAARTAAHDLHEARAELAAMRASARIQAESLTLQCRDLEHSAQAAAVGAGLELAATRAELARVREALLAQAQDFAAQRSAAQQSADAATHAAGEAMRTERARMLEILHATQEALEHSYAESDGLLATATGANALLRQAWLLIAAQSGAAGMAGSCAAAQPLP